jgi:hypothetical protein
MPHWTYKREQLGRAEIHPDGPFTAGEYASFDLVLHASITTPGGDPQATMGKILPSPAGKATFRTEVLCSAPVERLEIFNGPEKVAAFRPDSSDHGQPDRNTTHPGGSGTREDRTGRTGDGGGGTGQAAQILPAAR